MSAVICFENVLFSAFLNVDKVPQPLISMGYNCVTHLLKDNLVVIHTSIDVFLFVLYTCNALILIN